MASDLLQDIIRIAKGAGEIIMRHYAEEFKVMHKDDMTPLTKADTEANDYIVHELKKYNNAILSEEIPDDKERLSHKYVWIVDPLDGTKHFVRKDGEFGVMIALVEDSRPILGVVHVPARGMTYYAEKDQGAFVEQSGGVSQLVVGKNAEQLRYIMGSSHIIENNPYLRDTLSPANLDHSGCIGIKVGLIAEDKYDITFNTARHTKEWDTAAPDIILEEAGGLMTDLYGNHLKYNKEDYGNHEGFIASNGQCHEKVRLVVERFLQSEKGWR